MSNKFWIKNKFTILSLLIYFLLTILFGDIKYKFIFILSIVLLPYIYNYKIENKSIWLSFFSGFIFGIYTTPFNFFSESSIYSKISYFILIISLNTLYHLHRFDYIKMKNNMTILSNKRDKIINDILNPLSKKFFQ
jgi:hypothetical protein